MDTKNDILDFLEQNRMYLSNNYHISKIALFGSFVKNKQNDDSDVDILIDIKDDTKNIHELKLSLKCF